MSSISSFTVAIHNRDYSSWAFYPDNADKTPINVAEHPKLAAFVPLAEKWLNGDVITMSDDGVVNKSVYGTAKAIPGVLLLEGNKTFGRTPNNKRLYYKCIPFDRGLPVFLIPYNAPIGFSKVQTNHYVTFHYDNWLGKHPYGILTETLGNVDDLCAFYEYQLHCNNLNTSIVSLTKTTTAAFKSRSPDEYINQIMKNADFQIEDRQSEYVFSIDPEGSVDFDDAFSIQSAENNTYRISIYIANVFVWLETLNLWNELTDRPSTIYLPDRKRTMLPAQLSDDLCSLQENQPRFALALDIVVNSDGRVVTDIPPRHTNAVIRVKKNFVYEEPKLLKNAQYKTLFDISKRMDASIGDSHDVVAHFMVLMNSAVGKYMKTQEIGIFRSAAFIQPTDINEPIVGLNEETSRIIRSWKNTHTQYTSFSPNKNLQHDIMGIDAYVHITSPIRRLVDLLNQMILSKSAGIVRSLSSAATGFLTEWMGELDYINSTSKSIRKVQMDCELLTKCINSPEIMDSVHDGIVIEKTGTATTIFAYMVYIEQLKMMTRVKTDADYSLYSKVSCKLYLFQDEDKVRNKIRTAIL